MHTQPSNYLKKPNSRSSPSWGAMLKRRSNILTLFRFFVSAAIADFGADGSSKWTTETFSFRLKRLQEELVRPHQAHTLRGTAQQCRISSCSTAMQPLAHTSSIPDSNRSIPSKFRQKVTRYAPAPHLAGICSAGIGQQTISAAVASRRFRIPAFFLGKI